MSLRKHAIIACAFTLLFAGCGGSGGGGAPDAGSVSPSTGPFSLEVVDTPVDPSLIERVCIAFSAVTVHYANGDDVRFEYEPQPSQVSLETHCSDGSDGAPPLVRLDALRGALSVHLVESQQIPTGLVTWIRLHFTEGSHLFESNGSMHLLTCPSCEVTDNNQGRGFKLIRSFEMTSAGLALIADIDLRKSLLHKNSDGYVLRPTVRLERSGSQGAIAGHVATDLIMNLGGETYLGGVPVTGCAVYVFPADGSPLEDLHPDTNVLATAEVSFTGEPEPDAYSYSVGVLPVEADGSSIEYRVALTCSLDDIDVSEEEIGLPAVEFTLPKETTVRAGRISYVDFP